MPLHFELDYNNKAPSASLPRKVRRFRLRDSRSDLLLWTAQVQITLGTEYVTVKIRNPLTAA
jgi:hypothetical protein